MVVNAGAEKGEERGERREEMVGGKERRARAERKRRNFI
jgi:hypothetical protein